MNEKLEKYKNTEPEIVFEWNDTETDARGWIVINSLKNGAAGGGTRMRKGLTKDEVVSLAKVMEIKFGVCGPDIGGAKSGIDFDPSDPRRREVLERWFKAVFPILKNYYGTGGDLNVDELKDVIPITEDLGLWHPQEGIVNGHFHYNKGDKIHIVGQLRYGCAKIIEDRKYVPTSKEKYAVADMITGWGVCESVRHFYNIYHGEDLRGKRVIVQGWGNVASAAGYYLSRFGSIIVGIIDRDGGIISENGLSESEVESLFVHKKGNRLNSPEMQSFEHINEKIWDIPCDIFIPAASSKLLERSQMDRLIDKGCKVISCGANVPFVDDKVFFGPTADYVDDKISVIPDFVANCGMARVFAYLMDKDAKLTDEDIFTDVSKLIESFIVSLFQKNNSKQMITKHSLSLVLNKIL
ncbi:MAG: Glu/Leu/Phe/Val dehydrogenase [Saprospiraceae bacterium]|nr:Glu/Leu/Phe/Val dehydrogenase [Saprospiraceae bacterium]MCB9327144.1 Glu/Leu/Phe/Val dehydrogenase [Lewinellaceae bacterium]